jgi:hypothetical protein
VRGEFARVRGRAVGGKIGRARTDDASDAADPDRDHARIRQLADTQREIDMLIEKIDDAVDQHHLDIDLAIGLEELRHDRDEMETAEHDRRGQDEFAPGRAVFAGRRPFRFAKIVQNAPTRLEVLTTGVRQGDLPGRAIEQLHPQCLFELGHFPAHGRQRHTQAARGRGEALRLHHYGEYRHRLEPVHLLFQKLE